ncbi:hypothetical protein BT96DRAFT_461143 [Gymnopus androsaceus JB14]|uniref:Uncharacterized protein n=1 Tax=Gymnopus androsaceus JB14 TaxID=1447944 RepID=A0A6A4IJ00_9AGAR|nr:hypothetical protein BT96DRAFT_461143 [Gymnopus androsaceus JB14]
MPPLHSSRRGSGSGPLPPFTQLPPMLDSAPRSPHHERTRSHSSHNLPPQQAPYHGPGQGQQQYSENLPPMQHVLHSPPLSDREREGSRSRRHDLHELAGTHDSHAHSMPPISPSADTRRVHNHQRMGPGTYINDPRGRELEREREREREWEDRDHHERDLNYSNTRQREREPSTGGMHSPPGTHRSRDYPEQHHSRAREEYYHENSGPSAIGGVYSRVSRSGTPGSGSRSASVGANDGPSRPDSRGGYFDDRSRGYRHRPPSHPEYYPNEQLVREPPARDTRPPAHYTNTNEELVREPSARDLRPPAHYTKEPLDFVHEDGRSQSRDRSGSGGFPPPPQRRESGDSGGRMREREGLDSRKKNRGEMDVDEEIEENTTASGGGGMSTYTGGGVSDERDRGLQRYHRGSGDNIEDVRMGP